LRRARYSGALYEQTGQADDARALTRRALFEASRSEAPDAAYRWYWQLGRIERAAGDRERALVSFREAVRILDTLRAELAISAASDAMAFRNAVERYTSISSICSAVRTPRPPPRHGSATGALREARDALESLKAAELRDYYGDPCLAAQRQTAAESVPARRAHPVCSPTASS